MKLTGLGVWLVALAGAVGAQAGAQGLQPGAWRAVLGSPGGELPFGLWFGMREGALGATIVNGVERIEVGRVAFDAASGSLELGLEPYDSVIAGRVLDDGRRLDGTWRKRSGADGFAEMRFSAVAGSGPRFAARAPVLDAGDGAIDGRWAVQFERDEHASVGLFETREDGTLQGTFLTALGDYRYLAGSFEDRRLRLSCFDGAHAFLFHATLGADGNLRGDFWSSGSWHETWTARRDDDASLADAFALTTWTGQHSFVHLSYPDLDGRPRSLNGRDLRGRPRVMVVFGSWCPNCKDATRFLVELDRRYKSRGLRVLGLAFERTGDFERDSAQVRRYVAHQGIEYPVLIAGLADKRRASAAFPVLDRVRAYPTTIFMRGDGSVHSVHTGFSGPATGEAHDRLRARFVEIVEELLDGR